MEEFWVEEDETMKQAEFICCEFIEYNVPMVRVMFSSD